MQTAVGAAYSPRGMTLVSRPSASSQQAMMPRPTYRRAMDPRALSPVPLGSTRIGGHRQRAEEGGLDPFDEDPRLARPRHAQYPFL